MKEIAPYENGHLQCDPDEHFQGADFERTAEMRSDHSVIIPVLFGTLAPDAQHVRTGLFPAMLAHAMTNERAACRRCAVAYDYLKRLPFW